MTVVVVVCSHSRLWQCVFISRLGGVQSRRILLLSVSVYCIQYTDTDNNRFDEDVLNNHVSAVCKSVRYHIRVLRHIRSSVSEDMAKMVACAVVGSRLDYANSVVHRIGGGGI